MATNRQLKLRAADVIAKAINDYEQRLEPVIELMDSLFYKNEDLEIVGKIVPLFNECFALYIIKLRNHEVVKEELSPKFVMAVKG